MESIKGIVNYKDTEYPFYYEQETLSLFPPSSTVLESDKSVILDFLTRISKPDEKRFLDRVKINGITNDGKNVVFAVSEQFGNDNGFLSSQVYWYYVYSPQTSMPTNNMQGGLQYLRTNNQIKGISVGGKEIDYFYNPRRAFKQSYLFDEETKRHIIQVTTEHDTTGECGEFTYKGITIKILVCAYSSFRTDRSAPFDSYSRLLLEFSRPISIEDVEDLYFAIRLCFCFLCRRSDVSLERVETFDYYKDGGRNYFGSYNPIYSAKMEELPKKNKRIIPFELIGKQFAKLLEYCASGRMYTFNLPKRFSSINSYSPDRTIFDMVAFEKAFGELYPEYEYRSQSYIASKESILLKLDELIGKSTGETKKYFKQFKRGIESSSIGLGMKLKKTLTDYSDVMNPFLTHLYGGSYADEIGDICERLNSFRNNLAHGNDFEFAPVNFDDLALIEQLVYAMKLRSIGMNVYDTQRAISQLFGINVDLRTDSGKNDATSEGKNDSILELE